MSYCILRCFSYAQIRQPLPFFQSPLWTSVQLSIIRHGHTFRIVRFSMAVFAQHGVINVGEFLATIQFVSVNAKPYLANYLSLHDLTDLRKEVLSACFRMYTMSRRLSAINKQVHDIMRRCGEGCHHFYGLRV